MAISPDTASPTSMKNKLRGVGEDNLQAGAVMIAAMLAVMWLVQLINWPLKQRLDRFGIWPHHLKGLRGILFAPFLHIGWGHLIGNTIPFAVMGFLVAMSGAKRFISAVLIIMVVGGLGAWVAGSANSTHVGASGIVFGFLGYLVFRGLFEKNVVHTIIGVVVGLIYGSFISGVLPNKTGISWQGHLFGFIGGVLAAWILRKDSKRSAKKPAAT
jgi:membrane associated rhomboid family serine protease